MPGEWNIEKHCPQWEAPTTVSYRETCGGVDGFDSRPLGTQIFSCHTCDTVKNSFLSVFCVTQTH